MASMIISLLKLIDDNFIIITAAILIFYVIISTSLYFIYDKVGIEKKKAIIPIVNIINLLDLISLPKWLAVLIFVPYINYIGLFAMSILCGWRLGKVLHQSKIFTVGLMFLPFIFFPILSKEKLVYDAYPASALLIKEKVVVVESDEVVIDIPNYEVEIKEVKDAIDISDYIDKKMYLSKKTIEEQIEESANEVADLTFDYDKLYNGKKDDIDNSDEKEDVDITDNQDIQEDIDDSDVQDEQEIIDDINDSNSENLEGELEMNQEQNNAGVSYPTPMPPVAPIPGIAAQPVIPNINVSIPEITPVTQVQEVPAVVVDPMMAQTVPVAPVPEVAMPVPEVPTEIPEVPTIQPEVPTVQPEVPTVQPEVPTVQPEVPTVEPMVTTVPNITIGQTSVQAPIAPTQPIDANMPQPAVMPVDQAIASVNEVVQPAIPEIQPLISDAQPIVPEISVVPEMQPSDANPGYTLDYNQLYNIPTAPVETAPVPEVVPEVPVVAPQTDAISMAPVETNNVTETPGVSIMASQESFNTLQMAAPPSFEIVEEPVEEVVEEAPVIPEVAKEDLVSIDIIEPDALPVGNSVKNSMNAPTVDYTNIMTQQIMQPETQLSAREQMNPFSTNYNEGPTSVPVQSMTTPVTNNVPNVGQQVNNAPLLRENADDRQVISASQGPIGAKFIENNENKYTLPKEEPIPVQLPTDPGLVANPMSIFGSSQGALRPTAVEAMQNSSQQVQPVQQGQQPVQQAKPRKEPITVCPNCGFIVKEGQPSCVVCGYRFD